MNEPVWSGREKRRECDLRRELGRYLKCLDPDAAGLNETLYRQESRDIASAQRLKQCRERLGGYPELDLVLLRELDGFVQELSAGQRRARLLGKELDAALEDPRWDAQVD